MKKNVEKPKIIILSNSLWNIFNYRNTLLKTLSKKYDTILVCSDDLKNENTLYNKTKYKCLDLNFNRRTVNPFRELLTFVRLLHILMSQKPSLILSFTIKPNIYGALISRFLKIPIITNVTD